MPEGISFFAFHFSAPGDCEAVAPADEFALFNSGKIEPMLAELGIDLVGMRQISNRRRECGWDEL